MLESKERELQKIEHDKLVTHLVSLLRSSYYDITFTPIKTNMNYDTGVVTQYVNLLIFNSSTRKIENINNLVNEVLYNTLNIERKKNDLHNTVIIVDNELEAIKEDLKKITGCDILMRCV